jgi:hypothetical protein
MAPVFAAAPAGAPTGRALAVTTPALAAAHEAALKLLSYYLGDDAASEPTSASVPTGHALPVMDPVFAAVQAKDGFDTAVLGYGVGRLQAQLKKVRIDMANIQAHFDMLQKKIQVDFAILEGELKVKIQKMLQNIDFQHEKILVPLNSEHERLTRAFEARTASLRAQDESLRMASVRLAVNDIRAREFPEMDSLRARVQAAEASRDHEKAAGEKIIIGEIEGARLVMRQQKNALHAEQIHRLQPFENTHKDLEMRLLDAQTIIAAKVLTKSYVLI